MCWKHGEEGLLILVVLMTKVTSEMNFEAVVGTCCQGGRGVSVPCYCDVLYIGDCPLPWDRGKSTWETESHGESMAEKVRKRWWCGGPQERMV